MKTLGIVMAKSGSTRTPNKNIADICGKPTLSYPIEALKASGVCDTVIVSTDSEEYGSVALDNGADDYIMRESWSDKYAEFSVTADDARRKYEEQTSVMYDKMVVCGGNVMFLRPSWVRAASVLMKDFVYNLMPIDVVGMEPYHWNVNVCRVKQGIVTQSNFYVFKHIGILMEMDWPHEVNLARDLQGGINDQIISYPLTETVHDDLLRDREKAANRMRGLMLRTQLLGVEVGAFYPRCYEEPRQPTVCYELTKNPFKNQD